MSLHPSIQILSEDDYWDTYMPLCTAIADPAPEVVRAIDSELGILRERIRQAFETEGWLDDVYIMDDWNVCWHDSISTHSNSIPSPRFIDVVLGVLASMEHDWCFHVSCEMETRPPTRQGAGVQLHIIVGDLFFHQGQILALTKEDFDYGVYERPVS